AVASGGGAGIGVGMARAIPDLPVGGGMGAPGRLSMKKQAGESLGKEMIEGGNAEGTRGGSTIEAGAIGNKRPIQITRGYCYSDELQMVVMSKHSDPRMGDESFRLTNVSRSEPAAYLFQAPSGYQINERK